MPNPPIHHLKSHNDVDVDVPSAGAILRSNAIGRWRAAYGEIDGSLGAPTVSNLDVGAITIRYLGGYLILYVNDGGVIKQLNLGEPG